MVDTVTTISGAQQNAAKTQAQQATLASDFSDFLTLLTTQLQNQDPLAPMDANEFTNQLVQFSQVEQQINANKKLDSIVNLQLSSSISAALGYVGLDANYVSNEMNFDGTNPVNITYNIDKPTKLAKLNVVDESGNLVYTQDITNKTGRNSFSWDGSTLNGQTANSGTYTVRIDAIGTDDKPVTSSVVVQGRIRGIETQDGQILLLVGERAVPLANVLNAHIPEDTNSETPTT